MYTPREDSHMLAEQVTKLAKGKVLDVGTGSGVQAIAAAKSGKVESILAVDSDEEAISYCKKNIAARKITFKVSDLFSEADGKFDTIIFNPPYLPKDEEIEDPALYGGKEGHELIERLFESAGNYLEEKGIILMVFSSLTNKEKVDEIITSKGFSPELLSTKHFFFEDLYVYKIVRIKSHNADVASSQNEEVIIANLEKLNEIKDLISKDGPDKFHVLSDFDKTLTKAFSNGKKVTSVISVLRNENYISAEYSDKAQALFNKYHPIEINYSLSLDERKKAMQEWWRAHFDLLMESGLNKKDLEKVVDSGIIKFKNGAKEFINYLHDEGIPLVIMSASGVGDTIPIYLEREGLMHENVHVITNLFEWDESGKAVSVKEPIIHSLNKDETAIQNFLVFDAVKERKNVLILGDSIDDIGMVHGFDYKNLIKIGFLVEDTEKYLEEYKKSFDVVIKGDTSMQYAAELIKELFR